MPTSNPFDNVNFFPVPSDIPPLAPLPPVVAEEELDENPTLVCDCCGDDIAEGDEISHNGEPHCSDCLHTCANCNHTTTDTDDFSMAYVREDVSTSHSRNSQTHVCGDCSFECNDCNNRFVGSASNTNANDNEICGICAESYRHCDDCGGTMHEDDSHYDDESEQTLCNGCHRRNEQSARNTLLHSYSFKPLPQFKFAKLERVGCNGTTAFFGIELEVDHEERREREDDIRDAELNDHPALYCKEDGSLNRGFEIVSHPGTWQFWQSFDWSFADKLRSNGYRSYNTTTCGMHIHVSKAALSELDQFKLLQFFRTNQDFIVRLSRRAGSALSQWASIEGGNNRVLVHKIKNGPARRYEAINLTPSKTVEFRIFRGTLDKSAIRRNIALIVALCAFVKATGLQAMHANHFFQWLRTDGGKMIGKADAKNLMEWVTARVPSIDSLA